MLGNTFCASVRRCRLPRTICSRDTASPRGFPNDTAVHMLQEAQRVHTVQYSTVFYCTVRTTFYLQTYVCTVLHCAVLYCTVLYCSVFCALLAVSPAPFPLQVPYLEVKRSLTLDERCVCLAFAISLDSDFFSRHR